MPKKILEPKTPEEYIVTPENAVGEQENPLKPTVIMMRRTGGEASREPRWQQRSQKNKGIYLLSCKLLIKVYFNVWWIILFVQNHSENLLDWGLSQELHVKSFRSSFESTSRTLNTHSDKNGTFNMFVQV